MRYGVSVTIDGISKVLNRLAEKYPAHLKDGVEYVGLAIRKDMIEKAASFPTGSFKYQGIYWRRALKERNRQLIKEENTPRRPYQTTRGTNLAEVIRSIPHFHLNKVVVGWQDTASFKDSRGRMIRGAKAAEIGDRMEGGGRIPITPRMRGMLHHSGFHTKKAYLERKAYPVVSRTALVAEAIAERAIEKKINQLVNEANK
ncbi:MAG: hypothetical protein LBT81_02320 [Helicobacteraceae bacterium]|jgi:hypothetical protein|nr:hypothetical protein [Helicobacteraceae bacterium]